MATHPVNAAEHQDEPLASDGRDARGGPARTRFFAELALSLVPAQVEEQIRAGSLSVCDWGCAEGDGAAALARRWSVEVAGLDPSEAAVARARLRHPGLRFACAPAGLDRAYDVLFTSNTLQRLAEPWPALEALLPRVRRYALVLVPLEEEEPRLPEHLVTFRLESFPLRLGPFALLHLGALDCAGREALWPGRQALAVYAREGTAPPRATAADLAGPALARAARAEARAAALEAELGAARAAAAASEAALGECAAALDAARATRWYRLGRAATALRHDPVGALAGARGREAGGGEGRASEDPVAAAAARLRTLPVRPAPPPEDPDARYRATLRSIEARCLAPAAEARLRHAADVDALDALAARSRGLVIHPPSLAWGQLRQRPQQLLAELGRRGHLCVFLTPDPRGDGVDGLREVEPGVLLCSDFRLVRHLRAPAVWVSWPPNAVYATHLADSRLVYDHLDELEVDGLHCPEMEAHHARLLRSAHAVIASAERLHERVRAVRPDAILAPNAVRPEDFSADRAGPVPEDLAPILALGRPVVGYHGVLARWLDYALLNAVTGAAPDLSFVLLGPDYDGSSGALARRPNVFLLGHRPYHALPGYVRRFGAAMVPFLVNDVTRATSPVKLFEYLAAGAPPVATPIPECGRLGSVRVAADAGSFLTALREALAARGTPAWSELAARDVAENTWARRVDRILPALQPGDRDR